MLAFLFSLLPPCLRRRRLGLLSLVFSLGHDRVDLLGGQTAHLHHVVWFNDGQIIIGQKPFTDQYLRQFVRHPVQCAVTGDRVVDLLFQFLPGHDFNVPAAELAGQAHVLAPPSDSERQLVFTDQYDGTTHHLAKNHLFDFRRLQCIRNQLLQVVAMPDDINPLASQFVDDVLNAISPHTNAGADTVDPLVVAAHRYLAAITSLAGYLVYRDHSLRNLGDLLLKQRLNKLRAHTAEQDLYSTALLAYIENRRPDPFVGMVGFTRNLFALW